MHKAVSVSRKLASTVSAACLSHSFFLFTSYTVFFFSKQKCLLFIRSDFFWPFLARVWIFSVAQGGLPGRKAVLRSEVAQRLLLALLQLRLVRLERETRFIPLSQPVDRLRPRSMGHRDEPGERRSLSQSWGQRKEGGSGRRAGLATGPEGHPTRAAHVALRTLTHPASSPRACRAPGTIPGTREAAANPAARRLNREASCQIMILETKAGQGVRGLLQPGRESRSKRSPVGG